MPTGGLLGKYELAKEAREVDLDPPLALRGDEEGTRKEFLLDEGDGRRAEMLRLLTRNDAFWVREVAGWLGFRPL